MKPLKKARQYARMFLNSVGDEAAGKALEELAVANAVKDKSRDFESILVSPVFAAEERKKALESVKGELGLSEGTVKFLLFLSGEGAAYGLSQVLEKAVVIYSERAGKVKAIIYTPDIALGKSYEARIREALKSVTTNDVDVEYKEDKSLIGGVLIKIGSTMLDGSIKGQLRLLKDELIKGVS